MAAGDRARLRIARRTAQHGPGADLPVRSALARQAVRGDVRCGRFRSASCGRCALQAQAVGLCPPSNPMLAPADAEHLFHAVRQADHRHCPTPHAEPAMAQQVGADARPVPSAVDDGHVAGSSQEAHGSVPNRIAERGSQTSITAALTPAFVRCAPSLHFPERQGARDQRERRSKMETAAPGRRPMPGVPVISAPRYAAKAHKGPGTAWTCTPSDSAATSIAELSVR